MFFPAFAIDNKPGLLCLCVKFSSVCASRVQLQISKKKRSRRRTSEFLAVDGLAAGAVALGEVTTLQHELGDNTMETGTCVSVAVLASR